MSISGSPDELRDKVELLGEFADALDQSKVDFEV